MSSLSRDRLSRYEDKISRKEGGETVSRIRQGVEQFQGSARWVEQFEEIMEDHEFLALARELFSGLRGGSSSPPPVPEMPPVLLFEGRPTFDLIVLIILLFGQKSYKMSYFFTFFYSNLFSM